MKKIYFIVVCMLLAFCSCQDDEAVFDVKMPAEGLSFYPIAGGAVMHYKLPADEHVYNIQLRYRDAFGQEIIRTGSYACDSLVIVGFNEARQGVKGYVSLCDRNNVESEEVEVTFDTKDSGPVNFINNVKIGPGWGKGFTLSYELKDDVKGIAHVFYIGEDPVSKRMDTILLKSFALTKGTVVLQDTFKQNRDSYDIVVRAEDFRGYMVKERIWKDIAPYKVEKLLPSMMEFHDPEGLSVEDPAFKLGKEYLFDGDTKGVQCFAKETFADFYTYLAGPMAISTPENPEKPLFIIDMKEEKLPAEIRLYGMLAVRSDWPYGPGGYYDAPNKYGRIWTSCYPSKLPSSVTLFGSNSMDAGAAWEKIVHFEQGRDIVNEDRWCARCNHIDFEKYQIYDFDKLTLEPPCYLTLTCPAEGKKYRYLKVVVNEVFMNPTGFESAVIGSNYDKYVTLNELEIFTAKD